MSDAEETVEEIVVTSARQAAPVTSHVGNIAVLGHRAIEDAAHTHTHELLTRVAGVWVVRGSGQENLPSIRSPVLTGAGSCGAFLVLENGVPTRPAGFCNVNQLFELPSELASRVEVIRGPGNALYGSNAMHGTINVLLPQPVNDAPRQASLELGSHQFARVSYSSGRLGLVHADDGGFRENSGYRQTKAFANRLFDAWGGQMSIGLAISDLDQETAGFIVGEDAYKDTALNRDNLNPEAFRQASSQRLTGHWRRSEGTYGIDIRPFVRRSEMEFLQHFIPGQPLEENGHVSAGILSMMTTEAGNMTVSAGLDLEWSEVYLRETQVGPTEGSDFLRATRPEGKHYDYEVGSVGGALFVQSELRVSERWLLGSGLRVEYLQYDYDNHMLDGNTRDDGTACGFGGCLYTRPASRNDNFTDLAPKIGALFRLSDESTLYINIARGFRAPQMTELYRLQNGQQVTDLKSETINSVELGLRTGGDRWHLDSAIFAMHKRDSAYRDAEGFNVSGGRTRHAGIELSWDWQPHEQWTVSLDGTYARHQYDFDVVASRGETFVSGRDVDTAPRWQGSAEIRFDAGDSVDAGLQWLALGPYYLDAENLHSYPGHDLLNLRLRARVSGTLSLTLRANNLADRSIADRADFAFGNYRYFPGRGREFYIQLQYRPQAT